MNLNLMIQIKEIFKMNASSKAKTIVPVVGLWAVKDSDLPRRLNAVYYGLTRNAKVFRAPWISLLDYKQAIAGFKAALAEAKTGDRRAIAKKNALRQSALRMHAGLGAYAATVSNGDLTMFLLSGFQARRPWTKSRQAAAPKLAVRAVEILSGVVRVKFWRVPTGRRYELRYGLSAAAPESWTSQTTQSTRSIFISNLTPEAQYTFLVRAFNTLGPGPWSEPLRIRAH
jgi:hypothetical protein